MTPRVPPPEPRDQPGPQPGRRPDRLPDPRDREIADLLHDAVSDVDPEDRLSALRRSTQESAMSTRPARPWLIAALGAAAVVVVAAGAVAVVSGTGDDSPPQVARQGTSSAEPTPSSVSAAPSESASDSPSGEPTASPTGPDETNPTGGGSASVVPVYYVTDTAQAGPRLVREFHRVQGDPFTGALDGLTRTAPDTDGYFSLLPEARLAVDAYDESAGEIRLRVPNGDWEEPAPGMSPRDAEQAIQQVVWTLQGVAQTRATITFLDPEGRPMSQVFGVDVSGGVSNASALATLNHVSITTPEQGSVIERDRVEVSGVANSFEANVVCRILQGDQALVVAPFTAEDWLGDRLFPFQGTLPLKDVPPGEVTLRCETDDPTGGAEGSGPFVDEKTITVR